MVLSKSQIKSIDYSWEILSLKPNAMMSFYDHLFKIAPETIHYFPDDMTKQSEKLAYTIGFMVGNLDRLEDIKGAIEDVGRFHNKLDIDAYQYENLKIALIETIKENMESSYSLEIEEAWKTLIDYVSDLMINAPSKKKSKLRRLLANMFD